MERSCFWLNEVVIRARRYIEMKNENGEPEIVSRLIVPYIEKVLQMPHRNTCSDDDIAFYKSHITQEALSMHTEANVTVGFWGMEANNVLAQVGYNGKHIAFQASWAAVADHADRDEDFIEKVAVPYDKHLAMGVIQVILQYVHSLEPYILRLHYDLQELRKVDEPVWMEKERLHRVDTAFLVDTLLTGVGRFDCTYTDLWQIDDFVVSKSKLSLRNGKEVRTETKHVVRKARAFVSRVVHSAEPSFDDFLVKAGPELGKRERDEAELCREGYKYYDGRPKSRNKT